LTEPGRAVLAAAERALGETDNIRLIADEIAATRRALTIATSHLHARYTLLAPIKAFAPPSGCALHTQADPDDILRLCCGRRGYRDQHEVHGAPGAGSPGRGMERSLIMPLGHARPEGAGHAEGHRGLPLVGYAPSQRGGQISDTFGPPDSSPSWW
jgi:DNA-binding transcriptional LysR family regulator